MKLTNIVKLDHVEVTVPDPVEVSEFYQRVFGLIETERTKDYIWVSSQSQDKTTSSVGEIKLKKGNHVSFDSIAFASNEESKMIETPSNHQIKLCSETEEFERGKSKAPFNIVKLQHVTFKDPNPTKIQNFYREALGLSLSDQLGERFYWLRHNHEHHSVGVSHAKTPGVHHIAYELKDWGEVKNLCDHFRAEGVPVEFGPGRHGPGNNIFIYVVGPAGIRFEFFTELAEIYDPNHEPKDWAGGRTKNANTWGPQPPASFMNED